MCRRMKTEIVLSPAEVGKILTEALEEKQGKRPSRVEFVVGKETRRFGLGEHDTSIFKGARCTIEDTSPGT